MFENTRSRAVLLARFGAVAFALSACGYLVVTAQRRANPSPVDTPAIVEDVTTTQPAESEMFLQGSKSLVLAAPEIADESDATVGMEETALPATVHISLGSSKTLNWSPDATATDLLFQTAPAAGAPTFLPSSKVGAVVTPSSEAAAPMSEPVFLPSSKVKTQLNPLRPALVPGTTPTSKDVFMPSSKSLRLEVTKPPAPVAPPKNR